jgi:hypothetical protein
VTTSAQAAHLSIGEVCGAENPPPSARVDVSVLVAFKGCIVCGEDHVPERMVDW